MRYLYETLLVCAVGLIAILIAVVWSGEDIFFEEEYENFVRRVEENESFR